MNKETRDEILYGALLIAIGDGFLNNNPWIFAPAWFLLVVENKQSSKLINSLGILAGAIITYVGLVAENDRFAIGAGIVMAMKSTVNLIKNIRNTPKNLNNI